MILEFWSALVDITEDLLIWLSAKEVQATKRRISSLKDYKEDVVSHLQDVEKELSNITTEIELLEDFVNSTYNEKEL